MEALDIEANGSDGVLRLNISRTVTVLPTEDEYMDITGCRQPSENASYINIHLYVC